MGLAASLPVRGETLDRIVASVDSRAITQRDVFLEFRFEQFVDGKKPSGEPGAKDRDEILERLIEQALLAAEAANTPLPAVSQDTLASDLADIQKKFESQEAYRSALSATGLDDPQVLDRLRLRETVLSLTDKRLRPQAWVDRAEIEKYYTDTFVPAFREHNSGPPPVLADVEGKIHEILVQEKINKLLTEWIADLKANHQVELRTF